MTICSSSTRSHGDVNPLLFDGPRVSAAISIANAAPEAGQPVHVLAFVYRRDLRDHLEGSLPDRHSGRLLRNHPGVLDVAYDGSQSADDGKFWFVAFN